MPKLNYTQYIKQFDRREIAYERMYSRQLFNYLRKTYNVFRSDLLEANEDPQAFANAYNVPSEELTNVLTKIYTNVSLKEAREGYMFFVEPYEENRLKQKDFLDTLLGVIRPSADEGLISLWRRLLGDYVQVRIARRLTLINDTTKKQIIKIVEKGVNEGSGIPEIARQIRKEGSGKINKNRSINIARTESISAMNQGNYMAAAGSIWEYEKKWSPRLDARTRNTHREMEEYPWIPLESEFRVRDREGGNDFALYPGDHELSASNVINCRCAILLRPRENSEGNLVRR